MTLLANPFFRNHGAVPPSLFVGRDGLLQAFSNTVSRPKAGESTVWAVIGDRGQGKSSVRDFVASRAAASSNQSSAILEWTQAADESSTPLSRQLFATIPDLPPWERWLERLATFAGKAEGGQLGPVKVPRFRLRPKHGGDFARLARSRLRGKANTLVVLLDEIGISDKAATSSLNFARDVSNANGAADDLNLLVILFAIRRQAYEFFERPNAPRSPRRFELDDFSALDIQNLLTKTLPSQAITGEPSVAGDVLRLTGGRPDITMALLHDAWDGLADLKGCSVADAEQARREGRYIATLTSADIDRAAHHGTVTLARVDSALGAARSLANAQHDERPARQEVLLALGDLGSSQDRAHTRAEWLSGIKETLGATEKTENAFNTVWHVLTDSHIMRPVPGGRWQFRGQLLPMGLRQVVSAGVIYS